MKIKCILILICVSNNYLVIPLPRAFLLPTLIFRPPPTPTPTKGEAARDGSCNCNWKQQLLVSAASVATRAVARNTTRALRILSGVLLSCRCRSPSGFSARCSAGLVNM